MAKHRRRQRQDRLSTLPDELLCRILFFAPAKEGASTCVLSRRWRSLWHTSGAVNLDSRSYSKSTHGDDRRMRRRFLRGAEAALAAAHAHGARVTRLTVHAEEAIMMSLNRRRRKLVGALFSSPAARYVEELHASVTHVRLDPKAWLWKLYELSFGDLPSEALRELHITGFTHLTPGATFPRLAYLHLKQCTVAFSRLQLIVDACPQLATLHLESSFFPAVDNVTKGRVNPSFVTRYASSYNNNNKPPAPIKEQCCYRLVCPTITTLIVENYDGSMKCLEGAMELESPRLWYLRYHGVLVVEGLLFLKVLASSNVIQADLHITKLEKGFQLPFWQFIHGFISAKVLTLNMDFAIDHVAIDKGTGQDDLLGNKFFTNLEFLELEGYYKPIPAKRKGYYQPTSRIASAVTIANFLHCCPVLRCLHLKLKLRSIPPLRRHSVRTQAQLDFNKSVDRFKHRKRAMISLRGEDDWNDHEVSDILGLSERSFDCLLSSLRTLIKVAILDGEGKQLRSSGDQILC